ncbi:MAG: potassium channel family protein [Gaiellaceae bacterium]|nr:potassium channel family protein [Gaiellaceae bacterium]
MEEVGTSRLETFSDGVFAIAATLLVLEIGVDTARGGDLGHELTRIWPSYLAYVTSFLVIGILWMNHHHTITMIARVNRTFLFINMLLLLVVAFMPFPTKLVAQYLQKPGERTATIAYGATMLTMAVVYNVWWRYARGNRRLIGENVSDASLRAVDRAFDPGVPAYALVFGIAFVSPLASVIITLAIAVFYLPSAALFER